jgi:hypothetical protein
VVLGHRSVFRGVTSRTFSSSSLFSSVNI